LTRLSVAGFSFPGSRPVGLPPYLLPRPFLKASSERRYNRVSGRPGQEPRVLGRLGVGVAGQLSLVAVCEVTSQGFCGGLIPSGVWCTNPSCPLAQVPGCG
jgi:hypothetical protein